MKQSGTIPIKKFLPLVAVVVLLLASFLIFMLLPGSDKSEPVDQDIARAETKHRKPAAAEIETPELSESESTRDKEYMVLGKTGQIKLRRDLLKLNKVFDDGTTQYDYNHGEMVLTIQANGEVLLLPKEI